MSVTNDLLKNAEAYREAFAGTDKGALPMPPGKQVAIVACMDARLVPTKVLGLEEGDAHVIRNAGGRASDDAIRSLAISQRLLGTREVIVVHHTDCGMLTFSNEQIRAQIARELGSDASAIDFLPFSDVDQSVRDDLATIRSSALIPDEIPVRGFVYEVTSGRLREVG